MVHLTGGQLRGGSRLVQLGCQMLGLMWQRGWDVQHGGILYVRNV